MASELQRLTESLGRRLKRSVAIDDQLFRLQAYNANPDQVDAARLQSILKRRVSAELTNYIHSHRVKESDGMFSLPENAALGLTLRRYGFPLRFEDKLLGYLWLLASEGDLSDDDAQFVHQECERAGEILAREFLSDELRMAASRECLRDLLSADEEIRLQGANKMIEDGLIIGTRFACVVLNAEHSPKGSRDLSAMLVSMT